MQQYVEHLEDNDDDGNADEEGRQSECLVVGADRSYYYYHTN